MSEIQSCMGGFCAKRDRCANFHAATEAQAPAERLCLHGDETVSQAAAPAPLALPSEPELERPRVEHVPLDDRLSQIEALLTPAGVVTEEVVAALGFTTRSRPSVLLRLLVAQGRAFETGSGNVSKRYFPTAESRDAFATAYRLDLASRRLVNCKEASQRYREALNPALRRRPARGTGAAPAQGGKKAAPRPASNWDVAAGPVAPQPAKPVGPAYVAAEPDLSKAKITIAPPLRDRYAVTSVTSVVDSRECRPWAEAVAA